VTDLALYLNNLKWYTTDQQVEELLLPYGKVRKIRFVEDKTNGKSRGSCFTAFAEPQNALAAIEHLKNVKLDGNDIEINLTSSANFEQLNTHNRGRKERKEFMSTTKPQPLVTHESGQQTQGSFRGHGYRGGSGRGGYRGRGGGGSNFRPPAPPSSESPPSASMIPPEFESTGFMPHNRAPRYPFPPFGIPAMPAFAPHINPAFFPNFVPDPRDFDRPPRDYDRDPRDHDRSRPRSRDRGGERGDRDHDRHHTGKRKREEDLDSRKRDRHHSHRD